MILLSAGVWRQQLLLGGIGTGATCGMMNTTSEENIRDGSPWSPIKALVVTVISYLAKVSMAMDASGVFGSNLVAWLIGPLLATHAMDDGWSAQVVKPTGKWQSLDSKKSVGKKRAAFPLPHRGF